MDSCHLYTVEINDITDTLGHIFSRSDLGIGNFAVFQTIFHICLFTSNFSRIPNSLRFIREVDCRSDRRKNACHDGSRAY